MTVIGFIQCSQLLETHKGRGCFDRFLSCWRETRRMDGLRALGSIDGCVMVVNYKTGGAMTLLSSLMSTFKNTD